MSITREQYKEIFIKAAKTSKKLEAPDKFCYSPTVTIKQDDITITLSIQKLLKPNTLKPNTQHGYTGLSNWLGHNNYDYFMAVSYLGKLVAAKDEQITLTATEYNYLRLQYQMAYDTLNVEVIKRQSALKEKATTALLKFLAK